MSSRWRLFYGSHRSLASLLLLSLAPGGCQTVLGIHDVSIDGASGGSGGQPTGDGGAPVDGTGAGGSASTGASTSASTGASTSASTGASTTASTSASTGSGSTTADFSFAILSSSVTVPLGGRNVIEVEIRRTGGFSGDVTVAPVSPPAGLIVEPLTIPGGQTVAEVVVGAQAPLALGAQISFMLEATADDLEPRTGAVTGAIITGRPGALDETFGAAASGLARVSFGADDAGGFFDIDVIGDKIIPVGQGYGGLGGVQSVTTRLTADGGVDSTFAGGTPVRTRFGESSRSAAMIHAIGHQLDGRLIVMGWHEESAASDIALARYRADGSTGDSLFGSHGESLIDLGGVEEVWDGLVLANNKILVAGQRDGQLMVARAASDGSLDKSFAAPDGYLTWSLDEPSRARAIAVDSRDRIVVAGDSGHGGERDVVVARYLPDGQPDAAFGAGGRVIIESPGADEGAVAVAVLPDGRILVAGDSNENDDVDFQVRRLLADGSLDMSFGAGGAATLPITGGNDVAEAMLVLPDGRILVVGNASGGATPGPVLARYTRDGRLDPHFGTGGVSSLYVGEYGSVHCAALYGGHKVLIGGGDEGGSPGPGTYGIVARLWM